MVKASQIMLFLANHSSQKSDASVSLGLWSLTCPIPIAVLIVINVEKQVHMAWIGSARAALHIAFHTCCTSDECNMPAAANDSLGPACPVILWRWTEQDFSALPYVMAYAVNNSRDDQGAAAPSLPPGHCRLAR